jgi:glycosyltransferase involved in cell wall biosynthesis
MSKKISVALITNIIPKYREGFFDRILLDNSINIDIFCQKEIPGMNIKTIHQKYHKKVNLVKYFSADGEKIAWQFLPFFRLLRKYDVFIVQGNPRYLSDLFFGTLLRILNKKVVLWTMAHSYNSNKNFESIRLLWTKIFNYIFVYTDAEVLYLQKRGFDKKHIIGMNNGLDQKEIDSEIKKWTSELLKNWKTSLNLDNKVILLSCARVVEKNKFLNFLEIFPNVLKYNKNIVWCIIGDGDEIDLLKNKSIELGINKNILFIGEIYDQNRLAPWFLCSTLFIHPGAIGLGLLQAYGYGLPVITHGNKANHGPEFAAFSNNETGYTYIENDYINLKNVVISSLENFDNLADIRNNIWYIARQKYNVDIMAERFLGIISSITKTNH